jgi:hypothetical protein
MPLAAWVKRGRGSIHKSPVGDEEILAAKTRFGAAWIARASSESFCSSSSSGRSTSSPTAFGCCWLTARISFANSARGHGHLPCCASVASSIRTNATFCETGSGRRTRKKKSFSFWLSVETGKLQLTRNTNASSTTVSRIHRPQVMCPVLFELENTLISHYLKFVYPTIKSIPNRRAF